MQAGTQSDGGLKVEAIRQALAKVKLVSARNESRSRITLRELQRPQHNTIVILARADK